ncbi:MAG TPA: hypothetical protein VG099_06620 [Gemmataceae bacterium]|jgi:hypothetical protein|nr:hypothetical protein [Gemmataceae bacterium]
MTTHFLTDPAEHQASLEAKKAWAWMMKTQARTMQKWLEIGQGFLIGRAWAMRQAGTNQPLGRGYNEAFSQWLKAYDLAGIDQADRSNLFTLMDTPAILAWRRLTRHHPACRNGPPFRRLIESALAGPRARPGRDRHR